MDDPPAVRKARARIEADRAKAELWYLKVIKTATTNADRNTTLLQYVLWVYFCYAREIVNLAIELKHPVDSVRRKVENAIAGVAAEAFESKHYNATERYFKAGFLKSANEAIRRSPEWTNIQRKLKQIAEWQATLAQEESQAPLKRKPKTVSKDARASLASERRASIDAFIAVVLDAC
jgi:hypothetical protein